ncbi:hypothetical protein NX029_11595 [Cytobacillus firmus]|nr:hypothetical protein [Cytobacillus firmus]
MESYILFYMVEGVQNVLFINADIVGNISLQGPRAGMFPTAIAIVEDLMHLDKDDLPVVFEKGEAAH